MAYNNFSSEFIDRWNGDTDKGISNPYRCKNKDVIRRNPKRDMSQRAKPRCSASCEMTTSHDAACTCNSSPAPRAPSHACCA